MTPPSTWFVLWVGLLCSGGLIDAFNRNRKSEENGTQTSPQNQPLLAQILEPLFDEEQTDELQTRNERSAYPDNVHQLLVYLSPRDNRVAYEPLVSASQVSSGPEQWFLAGNPPFPPFFLGLTLYLPIPFCIPPFPFPPETDESATDSVETTFSIGPNFGFPPSSDNDLTPKPVKPTAKPPKVDFNVYYNTKTGVDLNPVKPLRPPSISIPPAQHSTGNSNNDISNTMPKRPASNVPVPKTSRLPNTERPDYKVATAGTLGDESMIDLNTAIEDCCKTGSDPNCFDQKGLHFVDQNPCNTQ